MQHTVVAPSSKATQAVHFSSDDNSSRVTARGGLMKPVLIALVCVALPLSVQAQRADTVFAEVGSPAVDGRVFKPHAARVRIYRGDSLVAQWLNELTLGDSAGRPVMRWVTTGEPARDNPGRPLSVLRQTYDGVTMAPLGYSSTSNTGAHTSVSIAGNRVRGRRRTAADTTMIPIDLTIQRPGFFLGASDLVPIAAGLETGSVIVSPMWSPGATTPDYRVFAVLADTTLNIEGTMVKARKVEERRRTDRSLTANWYLLLEKPYMVYGEVPLPDGRIQRMTEVDVPLRSGRP
jgi:hypothetical protein